MKKEADLQTKFNQYLRESRIYGYYELKYTEKNILPFSKIEIHQYEGLQASEKEGFVWKLSDQDMRQKPFDCFCTPPLPSYIVIKFRGHPLYLIRIKDIVDLRESGEIGITSERARQNAEKVVYL